MFLQNVGFFSAGYMMSYRRRCEVRSLDCYFYTSLLSINDISSNISEQISQIYTRLMLEIFIVLRCI
jgi:hypothetical protein